jgi:hypothetical protein
VSIEAVRQFSRKLHDWRGIGIDGQVDDNRFVGHAAPSGDDDWLMSAIPRGA